MRRFGEANGDDAAAIESPAVESHGGNGHIRLLFAGLMVAIPIYGKISDVLGRKPILVIAILLFMAGSLIGALAPTSNG